MDTSREISFVANFFVVSFLFSLFTFCQIPFYTYLSISPLSHSFSLQPLSLSLLWPCLGFVLPSPCAAHLCGAPFFCCCCCCCSCSLKLMPGISGSLGGKESTHTGGDKWKRRGGELRCACAVCRACACAWVGSMHIPGVVLRWCWWWWCCCGAAAALWWGLAEAERW